MSQHYLGTYTIELSKFRMFAGKKISGFFVVVVVVAQLKYIKDELFHSCLSTKKITPVY